MSHELRTPLSAIIGFSELIRERQVRISRDRVADYAQHVADADRRLLGIVEEVLEYASIERGDLRLLPQRMATRPLVAAAIRALRGWARSRKLSIATVAARDCPPMVADPEATTRVLEILIRDASKHLDAGGAAGSSWGFPGRARAPPDFPDKPRAGIPTGVGYTAIFRRIRHGGNLSPASSSSGAVR